MLGVMDNTQLPPGGDPQDYMQTQEFGPAGAQPWQQPRRPKPPRQHGRVLWWGAGLALVAVLAGGGTYTATALASSASPAGPTGQAAQLNSLLNSAGSPSSAAAAAAFARTTASTKNTRCQNLATKAKAAGHPVAAQRLLRLCRSRLARLRFVGGLHGSFTFKAKDGTTTLAYMRGTVQSVTSSDVVVKASDGTTWTWALEKNTVVRQGGKKASTSALADGEHVFAAGPVTGGNYQARLIVIARASTAKTPSSAPSPSPTPASGS
jgi:hypothetical protein